MVKGSPYEIEWEALDSVIIGVGLIRDDSLHLR